MNNLPINRKALIAQQGVHPQSWLARGIRSLHPKQFAELSRELRQGGTLVHVNLEGFTISRSKSAPDREMWLYQLPRQDPKAAQGCLRVAPSKTRDSQR